MNNREAVEAEIGIPGYEANSVTKAMIDNGIDATGTYTGVNTSIQKAALAVLNIMLAMQSTQEGGYQITYAIEKRIKALEGELGVEDKGQPVITDVSWKW